MGTGISGCYEGEGANVSTPQTAVPDSTSGKHTFVAVTRRRQIRVSSESARDAIAVTGSNQTLSKAARGIYVGGAGNLVCTLIDGSGSVTFTGLLAGNWYPFMIVSITGAGTTITNSLVLL